MIRVLLNEGARDVGNVLEKSSCGIKEMRMCVDVFMFLVFKYVGILKIEARRGRGIMLDVVSGTDQLLKFRVSV